MKTIKELAWALARAGKTNLEDAVKAGQDNAREAFNAIIAQETPSANATVKRMSKIARDALAAMG